MQLPTDIEALTDAFMANPLGDHGPALRHLLAVMRSAPAPGKLVLVEVEPWRRWRLAQLGERGRPVTLLEPVFDDLAEAERHVFRLRLAALKEARP
jgi:hypothetical protein